MPDWAAGLTDTGLCTAAAAFASTYFYGELWSDDAGTVVSDGRVVIDWVGPFGSGVLGLPSEGVTFTGTPGSPVATVAVWDAPSGGNLGAVFGLSGDDVIGDNGVYLVAVLTLSGSST
jgi:hypothetical protein